MASRAMMFRKRYRTMAQYVTASVAFLGFVLFGSILTLDSHGVDAALQSPSGLIAAFA